jgi:hypothetical protein
VKARVKAGRCPTSIPFVGLAKPALRMLGEVLTFYYGPLNFSCYYRDSAPGSGLPGLILVKRTHDSYVDLAAGGHRGAGVITSGCSCSTPPAPPPYL